MARYTVSQQIRTALWQRRAAGDKQYQLAQAADVDPSIFSALVNNISNAALFSDVVVGFHAVQFNTVSAHNALTIPAPETLGTGDGTPFQLFTLAHRPMFAAQSATPYAHVVVGVEEAQVFTAWSQIDDFPPGPGSYYRLNPVTGEVLGELDEEVATATVVETRDKFSVAEIQTVTPGSEVHVRDRAVPK